MTCDGPPAEPANEAPNEPEVAIHPVSVFHQVPLAVILQRCFADDLWTVAEVEPILAMPGFFGFLATVDALPVGCILLRQAADECELLWLAVSPDRRRGGLGSRLYRRAWRAAAERGVSRLVLEVADDNLAARAFYQAQGFQPVGERRDYYRRAGGAACDAVVMALALADRELD